MGQREPRLAAVQAREDSERLHLGIRRCKRLRGRLRYQQWVLLGKTLHTHGVRRICRNRCVAESVGLAVDRNFASYSLYLGATPTLMREIQLRHEWSLNR